MFSVCILHACIVILQKSPRIAQSSIPYVHHMLFYQCAFLNETTDLGPGGSCGTEVTVSKNIQKCRFASTWLAAWAVGGDVSLTVLRLLLGVSGCCWEWICKVLAL